MTQVQQTTGSAGADPGRPPGTEIVVVPHTHWDREWYEPFQRFRLRLVALLDEVLDRMDRDPRHRFTLDGQMAAVDDYLEVRPERRDQMVALVVAGRLAVGPWQILLDEFLCSGENVIRNLERGLRRSAGFGSAMPVGYLPDMFGHIAQMPQILAGAGLAHACVWRGVPDRVRTHAFAWVAPDGTAVRTEYLPGGYGNAAGLVENPALVDRRAGDLADRLASWRPGGVPDGPMLAMYGADHGAPAADAPDLLAATTERTGIRLRLGTMTEYFASQPDSVAGLPEVRGELRSHARANILPGVYSVRAHLKRAMGRAERRVERYAEPMAALWYDDSAERFLEMAWSRLIECGCHDSVTGCGCDETAEQVAARLAEADQLGRAVCDLVGARVAADVPRDGHAVFNPSPVTRTGLVHLDVVLPGPAGAGASGAAAGGVELVDGGGRRLPAQVLATGPTLLADDEYDADRLGAALGRAHGPELYGQQIASWSLSPAESTLTFHVARHGDEGFEMADVSAALAALADGAGPSGRWRVRILAEPRATVAALVEAPGLGFTSVRPMPPGGSGAPAAAAPAMVSARDRTLDNGLIRAEVADDGTVSLHTPDGWRVAGLGRLVDGGDLGDTYNYAPPARDRLVDEPDSVRTSVRHAGPLVGVLDVVRTFQWPVAADLAAGARSERTEAVTVTARLELRSGERFLRFRYDFDNRADDHRLRLHLPLPSPAAGSFAEGQFAVVERGLTAEGGGAEVPLPTFPAAGFVSAGGADAALAVLLTQPTEYELVDDGRELAVTLLRSVGMLSRNRNPMRHDPAGPQLPTPAAQCRGGQTVELALLPFRGTWHAAGVPADAEVYRHELRGYAGAGPVDAALPPATPGLRVTGDGVVLTSVRDRAGVVEVRVVAEHPSDTSAIIVPGWLPPDACRADLLGRPGAALPVGPDGAVRVPLRAWEIATVQLSRAVPR